MTQPDTIIARALCRAHTADLAAQGANFASRECFGLCSGCDDKSTAVLAALRAEGYRIVPEEPTSEMLSKGFDSRHEYETGIWRAMVSAAPAEGETR